MKEGSRIPSRDHDPESHPVGTAENPYAPMLVFGTCSTDGLGPTNWWATVPDPGMEAEEGGEEGAKMQLDDDEADF